MTDPTMAALLGEDYPLMLREDRVFHMAGRYRKVMVKALHPRGILNRGGTSLLAGPPVTRRRHQKRKKRLLKRAMQIALRWAAPRPDEEWPHVDEPRRR